MLKLPGQEESYWLSSASMPTYTKLNELIDVDVAVVGGGISGLTAAYLLKKAGRSVAVIEKNTIASGTSGNTTGKVTAQHGMIYNKLANQLGEKKAKLYAQANLGAIGQIEKIIKQEKIGCGWQRSDNYVYTRDAEQINTYQDEAKTAQNLGLPASFETSSELPFEIQAAVKFADQAQFNCAQYCAGLAAKIKDGGSYVFENTNASGIHDGAAPAVRTPCGTIHARNIIVATNVPTFPLLARGAYCVLEYPLTSYIVAARTKKKIAGMYISTDPQEYSILPLNNGKDNIILIGGEGHIRGSKLNKKDRYQRLAEYAESRFGAISVDFMWKAWDYKAYDNIPLAGKMYPWSQHLYVISAFKKWGLTNSMVAASVLSDLIQDQKNSLAEIYNPIRPGPIKALLPF